jgi:hypothetical protein
MANPDGATANGKTLADQEKDSRKEIMKEQRPADKPFGRCLVDFLTQPTDSGLRPLEKTLLDQCAKGVDVNASKADKTHKKALEAKQAPPANVMDATAIAERAEKFKTAVDEVRAGSVSDNSVRAEFLRFLILGGDAFAPVHEAGIQLWNARIDGDLELRSCKCVSRVALTNCVLAGELWMQDARLDVLLMSGSTVKGFHANRAKISGAMWLDENFYSEGEVELFGIEIGGRLDCSSGYFEKGIAAPGANIGGDLNLSRVTSADTISFINANIGGSMSFDEASLTAAAEKTYPLDFSRAEIKGDVTLADTSVIAPGWSETANCQAINAQNITVKGSVTFGGGFVAKGEVCFNGADVSKALDFSGAIFRNQTAYAIRAERAKVAGAFKFNPVGEGADRHPFESYGCISLMAAQCGELNCSGGKFNNLDPGPYPRNMALDCKMITVTGSVFMTYQYDVSFEASGMVELHSAEIGQHLYCTGGRFSNPGRDALSCQAGKIASCVFLNAPDKEVFEHIENEKERRETRSHMSFQATGKVTFVGASVGLQFIAKWGRLENATADLSNLDDADDALNLSSCRIADGLFLGTEDSTDQPPTIKGSVNLSGATVRVLVDDGLSDDGSQGLAKQVIGKDAAGNDKTLHCRLKLDQFTYESLVGKNACVADKRKKWLLRQPPGDLESKFKPQPFEQLITVMRAMGYDDGADDIAQSKRIYERQAGRARNLADAEESWAAFRQAGSDAKLINFAEAAWGLLVNFLEFVFLQWFIGYGYRMSRAVIFLFIFAGVFALFYSVEFQRGAIVPVDKDIRADKHASGCINWSIADCPVIAAEVVPRFSPMLYSADVIVPVIGFGQKAAWMPAGDADFVYTMQLIETVLGWVEGFLLVSFVTGLIAKE